MKHLPQLFDNNRRWAADISTSHPGFFRKLTAQQAPEFLWIGCSDSRVPANEIVGLLPGELFVHRNLADNWLRQVRDIHHRHKAELDAIRDTQMRLCRLCELNVLEQVINVGNTTILQDAWERGQTVSSRRELSHLWSDPHAG